MSITSELVLRGMLLEDIIGYLLDTYRYEDVLSELERNCPDAQTQTNPTP